MKNAVLLDTSFFIRLIEDNSLLKERATEYFYKLVDSDFDLFISTISIAEYCAGGNLDDLPFNILTVLPFELQHAKNAGRFASQIYKARRQGDFQVKNRIVIPNDTKLFAQADTEAAIKYYISSDVESLKIYQALQTQGNINFDFIDLNQPLRKVL